MGRTCLCGRLLGWLGYRAIDRQMTHVYIDHQPPPGPHDAVSLGNAASGDEYAVPCSVCLEKTVVAICWECVAFFCYGCAVEHADKNGVRR